MIITLILLKRYDERKSEAHNIIQFPLEVIQIIEQRIKETWSPEQIAAYYKNNGFPCYIKPSIKGLTKE